MHPHRRPTTTPIGWACQAVSNQCASQYALHMGCTALRAQFGLLGWGGKKRLPCSVAGCTTNSQRKDLCGKHGGGPGECVFGGCTNTMVSTKWKTCSTHGGKGTGAACQICYAHFVHCVEAGKGAPSSTNTHEQPLPLWICIPLHPVHRPYHVFQRRHRATNIRRLVPSECDDVIRRGARQQKAEGYRIERSPMDCVAPP